MITKGKPTINLDFSEKHPDKVTVAEVKSAITAKFPKVRDVGCPLYHRIGD